MVTKISNNDLSQAKAQGVAVLDFSAFLREKRLPHSAPALLPSDLTYAICGIFKKAPKRFAIIIFRIVRPACPVASASPIAQRHPSAACTPGRAKPPLP